MNFDEYYDNILLSLLNNNEQFTTQKIKQLFEEVETVCFDDYKCLIQTIFDYDNLINDKNKSAEIFKNYFSTILNYNDNFGVEFCLNDFVQKKISNDVSLIHEIFNFFDKILLKDLNNNSKEQIVDFIFKNKKHIERNKNFLSHAKKIITICTQKNSELAIKIINHCKRYKDNKDFIDSLLIIANKVILENDLRQTKKIKKLKL